MDILAHGLWGGAAFYPKGKKAYWTTFGFGVLPDLFSFGPHFVASILNGQSMRNGPPPLDSIPTIIFALYDLTHSFVVFAVVFALIFFLRGRKPFWPMLAWGLHIIMDIPTHSYRFFPTPFLWPVSTFKFNGFSWGQLWFIALNYSFIVCVYAALFISARKRRSGSEHHFKN